MSEHEHPRYPRCGGRAVPVHYGEPSGEVCEAAEGGEVVLGGCLVDLNASRWACPRCGHRFGGGA